jgi:HEAT repeat protein
VERLVALIPDKVGDVRRVAAVALGGLGSAAATPAVVERLVALSADKVGDVRRAAAVALGGLGSAAATPAVVERLVALSADKVDDVRWAAAEALGRLGAPVSAFDTLVEFWLPRLQDQEHKFFGDRYERVPTIAYEQLQRLAELREEQARTDETTAGHEVSGLHDRAS